MDLTSVTGYRRATGRNDLTLAPGEAFLAGGTWLYSEPQPSVTGLVDLTTLGWPALGSLPDGGLRIAATCTIAELAAARPFFHQCATALLASFKVWHVATVGGNICRSYAAAAMVSLTVTLDGVAEVWTTDGGSYRQPVADLITGNGTNTLAPGEVLRAVDLPGAALAGRTAFRQIALATLGRSGAVLTGRLDPSGGVTLVITAATPRPVVLRYPALPSAGRLAADVFAVDGFYTDPLGPADWRRQVSGVLLEEIRQELGG